MTLLLILIVVITTLLPRKNYDLKGRRNVNMFAFFWLASRHSGHLIRSLFNGFALLQDVEKTLDVGHSLLDLLTESV